MYNEDVFSGVGGGVVVILSQSLFRFVICLCLEAKQKQTTLRDLKIHFAGSSNEIHSIFVVSGVFMCCLG